MIFHFFDGKDGPLLGCVGLHPINNPRGCELGVWIRSDAVNRGLSRAAVRVAVIVAFELLGMQRVQCRYLETNRKSKQYSVGFEFEGRIPYLDSPECATILRAAYEESRTHLYWYRDTCKLVTFTRRLGAALESIEAPEYQHVPSIASKL